MKLRNWGPAALYVILCTVLSRFFWYNVGPDALSYLSIAGHYLRGEWMEAINTGWSPLTSWATALLMAVGLSDLAAIRVVTIAFGVLLLYAVGKLAEDFELSPAWQTAVSYTTAVMAVSFVMVRMGADMPEAAFLLLYIRMVIRNSFGEKGTGLAAGIWGAAAYFTKGYALYFFLGHFALASFIHFWQRQGAQRQAVIRQWAMGMLVFVILTGPWVAAMSYKMGHLTTGTTGAWNYRLVGPNSPGYPQYYKPVPLPSEHASSMWEEPAPDLLPAWSPLGSAAELKHQLRLVARNIKELTTYFLYLSLLSLAGWLAFTAWGWGHSQTGTVHWLLASITVLIYPAGYLLILVQDRYLWSIDLLLLLMGAVVVQQASVALRPVAAVVLAGVYLMSYLLVPARQLMAQSDQSQWARTAEQLRQQVPQVSGKVAGCGGWLENMEIAWAMRMPFVGETGPTAEEIQVREELNPSFKTVTPPAAESSQQVTRELAESKAEYLLAQPGCAVLPEALSQSAPVAQAQGTRLYRLSGRN